MIIDANVQPYFRYNSEIRRYISPAHKLRAIPDVELQWYQAPGGDYRRDLYGGGYPGSDPDTVTRHLFEEGGVDSRSSIRRRGATSPTTCSTAGSARRSTTG